HPDHPHTALADLLEQRVRADHRAGPLGDGDRIDRVDRRWGRGLQEPAGILVRPKQFFHAGTQGGIAATRRGEEVRQLLAPLAYQDLEKNPLGFRIAHGWPSVAPLFNAPSGAGTRQESSRNYSALGASSARRRA